MLYCHKVMCDMHLEIPKFDVAPITGVLKFAKHMTELAEQFLLLFRRVKYFSIIKVVFHSLRQRYVWYSIEKKCQTSISEKSRKLSPEKVCTGSAEVQKNRLNFQP